MKRLLFGLVLVADLALAGNLSVNVKNFNFKYTNPYGEGSATSFSRNQIMDQKVFVRVDKVDNNFHLNVSGAETQEFVLENAPSFMTEAETMTISGFNLGLNQRANLSLTQGRFYSREDSLALDGVSLDCARDANKKEIMDQLIVGCIQNLTLKTSKFSSQATEEVLVNALMEVTPQGSIGVNSLDLKISSGKYSLAADVKADISGKVKSSGLMSYDVASGKLTIKIAEVKFGFLNITGKVFDELKKKESATMTVKQPYVYLKLK